MKIAVTGKDGSGKTTIAAHLAKIYADRGFEVLVVDTDPNLNMSEFFGYEGLPPISKMKGLVNERSRLSNGFIKVKPYVRDIVDKHGRRISRNLRLLVSGVVEKVGSSCLCPENALLRSLFQEIILKRSETVIMDVGACLEIMNEGTLRGMDNILAVTEPNYGSVSVTRRLLSYSNQLGIKTHVVANKIRGHEEFNYISQKFNIFHTIQHSEEVQKSSMSTKPFIDNGKFHKSISKLGEKLQID